MGTLNPRPRGSRNLATNAKAARDDREQIRRLLNARTVPPAPSGGISGIARVWAWDLTMSRNPSSTLINPVFIDPTFTQIYGEGPDVTVDADYGGFRVGEAGIYTLKMDAWIPISGASDPITPESTVCEFWVDWTGAGTIGAYPANYHYPRFQATVNPDLLNPGGSAADAKTSWTISPVPLEANQGVAFGGEFNSTTDEAVVNYWSVDICKIG